MHSTCSDFVFDKRHILQVGMKSGNVHSRLEAKLKVSFDAYSLSRVVKTAHFYRSPSPKVENATRIKEVFTQLMPYKICLN